MKAKIYNTTNCRQETATGTCMVGVSRFMGCITITLPAARKMKIDENSRVEFVQDTDRPRDWYISVNTNAAGFIPVLRGHRGSSYYVVKSRPLTETICSSLGFPGKSFKVNLGAQDSAGLWPLITAAVR